MKLFEILNEEENILLEGFSERKRIDAERYVFYFEGKEDSCIYDMKFSFNRQKKLTEVSVISRRSHNMYYFKSKKEIEQLMVLFRKILPKEQVKMRFILRGLELNDFLLL